MNSHIQQTVRSLPHVAHAQLERAQQILASDRSTIVEGDSLNVLTGQAADGTLFIDDIRAYLLNEWALIQFAHNQLAAVVTGAFVVTAVGAFYVLRELHREQAGLYLQHGTVAGLVAAVLVVYPTGDVQA